MAFSKVGRAEIGAIALPIQQPNQIASRRSNEIDSIDIEWLTSDDEWLMSRPIPNDSNRLFPFVAGSVRSVFIRSKEMDVSNSFDSHWLLKEIFQFSSRLEFKDVTRSKPHLLRWVSFYISWFVSSWNISSASIDRCLLMLRKCLFENFVSLLRFLLLLLSILSTMISSNDTVFHKSMAFRIVDDQFDFNHWRQQQKNTVRVKRSSCNVQIRFHARYTIDGAGEEGLPLGRVKETSRP